MELGAKVKTMRYSNNLWITKYDNGVVLRKRNKTELVIDNVDAGHIAMQLREYPKTKLYSEPELLSIKKKFPDDKKLHAWIDRIMAGKLTIDDV